jgi:hypothetical protein
MKCFFAAAAVVLGFVGYAQAETWSKVGVPAGTWCQVEDKNGGWMWFTRGKCALNEDALTLTLKANGDFTLTGLGDPETCKAGRMYDRGWTDYTCTVYGARAMKKPKGQKKFVIDTVDGRLGLNYGE